MLEKNEKKIADAHFHYLPCVKTDAFNPPENWCGISCAHSVEEWKAQKKAAENLKIYLAYGIHPQQIGDEAFNINESFNFLNQLLSENKVAAIGECGFDFFTDEYKSHAALQEDFFLKQVELAINYKRPLIIHCRKANEKLFEYSKKLSKVPAVLFHSFMGTPIEAKSLINHGINGFFSFGRQLFNKNKKVIACVKELPLERLLLETDAPYQFLKGEEKTSVNQICDVYEEAYKIRNEKMNFLEFSNKIYENLLSLVYE